ncbi:MAG TPA: lysine 5,6-aminomutase subunit alpha, partial [Solirubrobacteraceae bacterium]|nr:lysine 5,6-aminomutase subunit alpha [Solirubrobacteraceae bacterium]
MSENGFNINNNNINDGSAGEAGSGSSPKEARRSKLDLDEGVVSACRAAAQQIAEQVGERIAGQTTLSVERSVVRMLGVDGANDLEAPLPNVLVDHVHARGGLRRGVAYWLGRAMLETGRTPQQIAEAVDAGELDLLAPASASDEPPQEQDGRSARGCGGAGEAGNAEDAAIRERVREECAARLREIEGRFEARREMRARLGEAATPLRYVLTATGDVYEDVVHAQAVAQAGGDIVAVIRSTAQSLLDYVPFGPTTEGYGGTFATQANFRIMREAMDEWSERHGRYVRLSSFCSGLC